MVSNKIGILSKKLNSPLNFQKVRKILIDIDIICTKSDNKKIERAKKKADELKEINEFAIYEDVIKEIKKIGDIKPSVDGFGFIE